MPSDRATAAERGSGGRESSERRVRSEGAYRAQSERPKWPRAGGRCERAEPANSRRNEAMARGASEQSATRPNEAAEAREYKALEASKASVSKAFVIEQIGKQSNQQNQ